MHLFQVIRKHPTGSGLIFTASALLALIVLLSPCVVHSFKIKLAWDPNPPEEQVSGYRLYYGTESCGSSLSCVYQHRSRLIRADRCKDGVCVYTFSRLDNGLTYYLALAAENKDGLESSFSGEVSINTCKYSLVRKKKKFNARGGSDHFTVRTQPACEWNVPSPPSWIRFTSQTNGRGPAVVSYTVSEYDGSEPRVAVLNIESAALTIKQEGQ